MKPNNPRFPHKCTIYRMEGETSFSEGKRDILYEGECRKYGNTSLRTFKTENVVKADYALSIPGVIEGIKTGYFNRCDRPRRNFYRMYGCRLLPRKFGNNRLFQSCKKLMI